MIGNQAQYARLRSLLEGAGSGRTILLSGPRHSGKETALRAACAESLDPDCCLFPDHGIDGAREAVDFSRYSGPVGMKCIGVVDAELLTDAGRDAYLKLAEETPRGCAVVLTSSDPGRLPKPLLSRVRDLIEWAPLGPDDLLEYAQSSGQVDRFALSACRGLPGMYSRIAHSARLRDLFDSLTAVAAGKASVGSDPPSVIAKLDSKSADRDAVVHLTMHAARSAPDASRTAMLAFARTVESSPSANSEIHWFRMVVSASRAV